MADPAAAAQSGSAQNSGAGKGVKAVLAAGSKGTVHTSAPARRHPGRPTAANAAGGEMHPAPSVWCALAEGSIWAERPGVLPGFPVRHPGGMGTNTTRICSPGKFEQRRPGPRAPPSIPVRGDGGWMCGGWSLAPVQSRRAANRRAANHRKEYIQMEISREMFETANLWRHR